MIVHTNVNHSIEEKKLLMYHVSSCEYNSTICFANFYIISWSINITKYISHHRNNFCLTINLNVFISFL